MKRHCATWVQSILLVSSSLVTLPIWLGGCSSNNTPGDRDTLPSEIIEEDNSSPDPNDNSNDNTVDPVIVDVGNYAINAIEDETTAGKWVFEVQSRTSSSTPGLTFNWDFGDGQTYTGQNQTFEFTTPGIHRVTVRAFSARGGLEFILTLDVEIPPAGLPPVAAAGNDISVMEGDPVTLDAARSADPDSTDLSFSWTQVGSGAPVTLSGSTNAVATFTAPEVSADTVLPFALTVSDGTNSSQDVVLVTVENGIDSAGVGPTANAGSDQEALSGDLVFLDGSASAGVGSSPLLFQWSQISGPTVTLVGHASAVATFTVQSVPPPSALLVFRLAVLQDGLTSEDQTQVTVYPSNVTPPPGGGGGGGSGGGGGGNPADQCPTDPNKTTPGQCGCGVPDSDGDGDGTADCVDDCPNHAGKSDPGICGCATADTDTDGDGTPDCLDSCPNDPGKVTAGTCGCGIAETDSDGDGTKDCRDGCPNDPGKTTPGICGCGVPDADADADGTLNCNDGCPNHPGKTSPGVCGCATPDIDLNGNGTPDCNDNCGVGLDTDGDGTTDCLDGCPADPNKILPGACGCGVADTDTDGDGTPNCNDLCPNHAGKTAPGVCGCAIADTDSDADGTPNCNDLCPNHAGKITPGVCGCGTPDTDSDADGTPNCVDGCPSDPNKTNPGTCGCGVADADSDGDGRANCQDGCPNDPNKFAPGACGCGVAETDTDSDGTPNCIDGCPNDFNKTAPGVCGCGVFDIDSDSDGTANCNDGCPNDTRKTGPGFCGCGTPDTDANANGTADCLEICAGNPLTDPGFEAGGTGWQSVAHAGRSVVTSQFHGGTKALEIQVSNQFSREVSQTVTATAGSGYDLSAWARTSGISGTGAIVRLDWLNTSGGVIRTDVTTGLVGTTGWTQLSANLTAPSATTQARVVLRLDTDPDNVGFAWFDDLVLCDRGSVDTDGDGVPDALDSAPNNPHVCRDADADGCDDCTNGPANPANDGPDSDGDGVCNAGDVCPGFDDSADADGDGIPDGCEPPSLCVSPTSLNFGSTTAQITFQSWNCGSGTLNYTIADNAAWLTVSPTSGSSVGEQDAITATVNRTGLANNTYTGAITVTPSVGAIINIVVSMTVAQGGTGAPVVQLSATRTSGVSPLGVVFDATATTSTGTTRPFHELDYTFDFGDPGSTFVNRPDVNANKAKGAIAAHVFELPRKCGGTGASCTSDSTCSGGQTCDEIPSKTYTVTLTVKNAAGATAQATQVITANTFTGMTFYVSDSTGSDSNTGLTQAAPFKTWDRGITMLFLSNGPRRLLFKRGETYTAPSAFAGSRGISSKTGPYLIGAFGIGAKPIIQTTHASTTLECKPSVRDVRFVDMEFRGPPPGSASGDATSMGSDFTVLRAAYSDHNRAVVAGSGTTDGTVVADSDFLNSDSYGIYYSASAGNAPPDHIAFLANDFDVVHQEHLLRTFITRSLVSYNTFKAGTANKDQLKFCGNVAPYKTEFSIISENRFLDPGAVAWMVSVGPQNTSTQEFLENIIIERNLWDPGTNNGKVALQSRNGDDFTIRNNVFKGVRTCISPSQPLFNFSTFDRWQVLNNTAYKGAGNDFAFISSSDASQLVTNLVVRNNIVSVNGPAGVITAIDLANMPAAQITETNNDWHYPNQTNGQLFLIGGASQSFAAWGGSSRGSTMADPLFVAPGTDLKLRTTSPGINAGVATPSVHDDIELSARPKGTTFDMGAYEVN